MGLIWLDGAGADPERPRSRVPRRQPLDPGEEGVCRHFKRAGELHQRVDSGHPHAALQHPDLRPVERGEKGELFLTETGPTAAAPKVGPELVDQFIVWPRHQRPDSRSDALPSGKRTRYPPDATSTGLQTTFARRSPTGTSRALASRITVSERGIWAHRSRLPTAVRCRSARKLSSSWVDRLNQMGEDFDQFAVGMERGALDCVEQPPVHGLFKQSPRRFLQLVREAAQVLSNAVPSRREEEAEEWQVASRCLKHDGRAVVRRVRVSHEEVGSPCGQALGWRWCAAGAAS